MARFETTRRVVGGLGKILFATALVATVAFGATLPTARRGPHTSAACSSPTLTGPTSAVLNDHFTIDGCGFEPGAAVPLMGGEGNGCCFSVNMVADANGQFSYVSWVWAIGTYQYKALVETQHSYKVAATWSFEATTS